MTDTGRPKQSPSLRTAIKALRENINEHVTTHEDPAVHNLSLALLAVALSLEKIEREMREIDQKVQRVLR
jgi:hypothetical protein